MIPGECSIYVLGKGFVKLADLTVGDKVYTLDTDKTVTIEPILSLDSEEVTGKLKRVDSGALNVSVTDDARFFYESDRHGPALIAWERIPELTPNKEYLPYKYLPVLSWMEQSNPNCSLTELEYVARMCAVFEYDLDSFMNIFNRCSGSDAHVLIDMMEFWCSIAPGTGVFGRTQPKTRSHIIKDKQVLDELCRIAVLAGFTAAQTVFEPGVYGLKITYEPMPIPGSRPKTEKYFLEHYFGNCYNVNASNKPIMGMSRNRVFYLPTASILHDAK